MVLIILFWGGNFAILNKVNGMEIGKDRKAFYSYGAEWERTVFDERTGGFIVTELQRKYRPMSKNDITTYLKEQRMALKYASFGFQIEHRYERPGYSSPDAFIRRHGRGAYIVNGQLSDFKSTKSANNIVKYGEYAVKKQGAQLVLFEFTAHAKGITNGLKTLYQKGTHGYYYFDDELMYYSF
jgi:hypothetical protein